MTGKERMRALLEGGRAAEPPVSLYITWPEYGWRFVGGPVWEVILGEQDGIAAMDRVQRRHRTDTAFGPSDTLGSGWLRGKRLERQTRREAFFRCDTSGRRWRFDLDSHVLVEVDAHDRVIDQPAHPGDSRLAVEPPRTVTDAEAWFARQFAGEPGQPATSPAEDRAVAHWGRDYWMITCSIAPFVAVAYTFGFEPSLVLLAERPRVFARLAELFLEQFSRHFAWAARAGYDAGHMVDSWSSADIISPATYRDWVAPLHRECARMIHSHGLKSDFYLPGDVMPLLPYLRGQGWDILRIDDLARGKELDIGQARRVLGPEQCLYGNLSAYALLRGDWEEIAARARYQHAAAGRDGRLVISNGSGICDQTDPAIVDRWLDYAVSLGASGG
ncbi:MAG: hypothetical protein GX774_20645 [Armatimonadetes bacterium]|jgi:hypothetical protein|nr:hypothetical protein [Armatimonadota bacterium]